MSEYEREHSVHYCQQCKRDMGNEWILGPVCGRCCRENHARVIGHCPTTGNSSVDARLRRNKRAREHRKARAEAMRSIGLVRVKGNLGGEYWE